MKIKYLLVATIALIIIIGRVCAQKIQVIETNKPVSIRGLSVVNNKVAWLSSSGGCTAITRDGGHTWKWQQVTGFEKADFRDIEAFSDKEAIIISSGTPALILKTTDGGANWQLKYRNDDKAYFLDAMDFSNKKHGLILGDPIDKKFLLMETNDGGDSWHKFANLPDAEDGEAAFAASGTCLRISHGGDYLSIVTGGTRARHLVLEKPFKEWAYYDLPITQGKASNGAFSVSEGGLVIVGGNYSNDRYADSVSSYFSGHPPYVKSRQAPKGYQSCVELIAPQTYLSTGTPGSNISTDHGVTWRQIDITSFNVCRKANKGKLVLFAGDKGKIGILTM
jgi:photosystem II stability/assembly factor-like uncharacterized protein